MSKTFVIKIGGSVLSLKDNLFNFEEANKIKQFFTSFNPDFKFVLTTGGGYLARSYQAMLKDRNFSDYDQHYIGTLACNMNAVMLRGVFGDLAEEKIVALNDFNEEDKINFNKRFLIAGGGNPGPSSDWDATWMAKHTGSNFVITLKDIDAVYSEDPNNNPNATKLSRVSWEEYLAIIGNPNAHKPGGNLPVDPIAAKFAKENNIKFYVISGTDFENLKNLIEDKTYNGTEIYV